MRRPRAVALAILMSAMIGAAPALAEQSVLSQILFGRIYNDGVTAIQVNSPRTYENDVPISVIFATRSKVREAQARAARDPHLLQALSARGIALKNVIEVQTAANGGKILYYR